MKHLARRLLALALALTMVCGNAALAADNAAVNMRLTKTEGDVAISTSSGKSLTKMTNMRLYNGYQLATDEESYAWVNLDDAKLAKLDAVSTANIRKSGKKLEILLDSGNIFFNVSKPLDSDESLNIRTSTMVVGIRGTSGWVEIEDEKAVRVYLLEGEVDVTVTDPVSGQEKSAHLSAGETAECLVYEQDHPGDKCDIVRESYTEEEVDGFVLVELVSNPSQVENIYQESGIDLRELSPKDGEDRLREDQAEVREKLDEISDSQETKETEVSTEPAWGEKKPESETPSDSKTDSDSSGKDDDRDGKDPSVPSVLPASATVPEIHRSLAVHNRVTVGNGAAAISIPELLRIPGGKYLLLDGPLTVTAAGGIQVNGTAQVSRDLINYGSITVNSAHTLSVAGSLTNHGSLTVTSSGRMVVDGSLSGSVSLTKGAAAWFRNLSGLVLPEKWRVSEEANSGGYYIAEYREIYAVSFQPNGGSAVPDAEVSEDDPLPRPADPVREGFAFTGWYTDSACTKAYDFSAPVTGEFTLYAGWKVQVCTVRFQANGGSAVPSVEVEYGKTVSAPGAPSRDGYTFTGWFADSGCTEAYSFLTPVTEDLTLYAGWRPNFCTVTFRTNGGSAVPSVEVEYGKTVSAPGAPSRDGYTFTGWFADSGCTEVYSFSTPVTEDLILYAGWKEVPAPPPPPTTYTVTFNSNGGSAVASVTVDPDETVAEPSAPTRDGYNFTGWFTDSGCTAAYDFTTPVTGNLTLYAGWEPGECTLTFDLNGGKWWTADSQTTTDPKPYTTPVNEPLDFSGLDPTDPQAVIALVFGSIVDPDGYSGVEGWYPNREGTGTAFDFTQPITASVTLYAKWKPVQYTVTLDENRPAGAESLTIACYPEGASKPDASATWEPAPTVNSGDSLGSKLPQLALLSAGGAVIYELVGWFVDPDDPSTEYTHSTAITANVTLSAKWSRLTYMVTLDLNGGKANDKTSGEEIAEITVPVDAGKSLEYNDAYDDRAWGVLENYFTIVQQPGGGGSGSFFGWDTTEAGTGELFVSDTPVTKNMTLYAQWFTNSANNPSSPDDSSHGIQWAMAGGTFYVKAKSYGDALFVPEEGVTKSGIKKVVVIDGSDIADEAFMNCANLESIDFSKLPNSIGAKAFFDCQKLTSFAFSDSLSSIGDEAFWNCRGLTSIEIPGSSTTIGDFAFSQCMGVKTVRILGDTTIGECAFQSCTSMESIEISGDVSGIGPSAFNSCLALTSVQFGGTVDNIAEYAFLQCRNLSKITIPVSVTKMEGFVFQACEELKEVTYTGTSPQWADLMTNNGLHTTDPGGSEAPAPNTGLPLDAIFICADGRFKIDTDGNKLVPEEATP